MVLVWLVTGCSVGLGKEICISALDRGHKVIATCRGNAEQRLVDLVTRGASVLSLDVAAPWDEIQDFSQKALGIYGRVDVVCNNAGYVQQGPLEAFTSEETLKQFHTLLFGPLNITRAFLPQMRERKQGVVCMIGSIGTEWLIPGGGLYISAKAALAALTQTLAVEVEPFNIKVTCIELGAFRTQVFFKPVMPERHIPEYDAVVAPTYQWMSPATKQSGDTHKGAERIVDLLTGEGYTEGRKPLPRIPLGNDTYDSAIAKAMVRIRQVQEWKTWSTGTDY